MRAATDFAARMARLRGAAAGLQPLAAPPGAATSPPASALGTLPPAIAERLSRPLAERLARLRPGAGIATRPRATDADVAARMAGTVLAPGLVRIDRLYRLPHRHGQWSLRMPRANTAYGLLDPVLAGVEDPTRLLLFDTETNGLSGGTGTIAFNVGCARFTPRGFNVTQLVLLDYTAEPAMLKALAAIAAGASALVTYNGRSFDGPLMQSRYRMHRMADPLQGLGHLDLLHWVRRYRPRDWPDARLATLESAWLGFEREDDIAGADVPRAWREWLADRDPARLDGVLRHNRIDLVTLACVLDAVMAPKRRSPSRFGPAQAGIFSG